MKLPKEMKLSLALSGKHERSQVTTVKEGRSDLNSFSVKQGVSSDPAEVTLCLWKAKRFPKWSAAE